MIVYNEIITMLYRANVTRGTASRYDSSTVMAIPLYCYYCNNDVELVQGIQNGLSTYWDESSNDICGSEYFYYIAAAMCAGITIDASVSIRFRKRAIDSGSYSDLCLADLSDVLVGKADPLTIAPYGKVFRGSTKTLPYISGSTYNNIITGNGKAAIRWKGNKIREFEQFVSLSFDPLDPEQISMKDRSKFRRYYFWWDYLLIDKLFANNR